MVKITQNITLGQQAYLKKTAEGRRTATRPAGQTPPPRDTVSISETSREIRQAAETPSTETAGNRSARIEELRQAIADGRYTVDPDKVAEGIIRQAFEG